MKGYPIIRFLAIAIIISVSMVWGCQPIDFTDAVVAHIQSETVTDSYQSEPIDLSSIAVSNTTETLTGGRYSDPSRMIMGLGNIDDRFKCAVVTHTPDPSTSSTKPMGTITIDFGTGCADNHGKTRKGMIIVQYAGKRFWPGSTVVITSKDFYKNDVRVDGKLTLTNVTASQADFPKFQIVLSGGKLTFTDGRTATREHSMTREWQRGTTPDLDKWIEEGTSSGTNKNGKSYQMTITNRLVYARSCELNNKVFIPVSGTKHLLVDKKEVIIDYGDGTCDNIINVTINGKTKTEILSDKGN